MADNEEHPASTISGEFSVVDQLTTLIEDYHSLNPGKPSCLPYPSPTEFSKQISKALPCVYTLPPDRGFCPAQSWTRTSLVNTIKEPVEVALTPNGRADSLQKINEEDEPIFLQPAAAYMTLSELFDKFDALEPQTTEPESESPVYYLQSQNGNLNSNSTALSPLLVDLPPTLPFAEPVLGAPEAINLWIGTSASVTSTHRDPYENLYLVLKGSKRFTLYAPVDEVALCARQVKTGRWVYSGNSETTGFRSVLDEGGQTIPWIPVDPLLPRDELVAQYPLYKHAQPQQIVVHENEILYLPAGWFHHVEQEGGRWVDGSPAPCIAVNYWFDQEYEGERYVMREFVGRLVEEARKETGAQTQP